MLEMSFVMCLYFPLSIKLQLSCFSVQAQIISLLRPWISSSGWGTKAHRQAIWERVGHCQDVGSDLWAMNKGIYSYLDQQISINTNVWLHSSIGNMPPSPCSLGFIVSQNFNMVLILFGSTWTVTTYVHAHVTLKSWQKLCFEITFWRNDWILVVIKSWHPTWNNTVLVITLKPMNRDLF